MTRSSLKIPGPRRSNLLHRAWLLPTNLLGHLVARLIRAKGPYSVGSARAPAQYYVLPQKSYWWFGAVTLGHVILAQPACICGVWGRWTMAHELAHTRQHDVLGPLYLPAHGLFQLLSAAWFLVRPIKGYSPFHAYNPLERGFMCVTYDFLEELRQTWGAPSSRADLEQRVLQQLGLDSWAPRPAALDSDDQDAAAT